MIKNALHITLHSTISDHDKNGESFYQKIQAIRQSVADLRDLNLDLERIRDQYVIHYRQCTEDQNILRQIYKKLKLKFDLSVQESQPEQQQQLSDSQTQPQQSTVIASQPETKKMPSIESIKLSPQITSTLPNPPSITLRYALNTSTAICVVDFSSDGTKFAFADSQYVYIINTEDGDIVSHIELKPHPDSTPENSNTRALKFSPNDELLAISCVNDVYLYDVKTRNLVFTLSGHQKEVTSIVFNKDGSWLISGSFDGVINIWDTKNGVQVNTIPNSQNNAAIIAISTTPEVGFYAIGFSNGIIGIFDDKFTPPMNIFPAYTRHDDEQAQDMMISISVSPFDETIATVSKDKTVKIWVMRFLASCKHTFEGHTDFVLTAAFSPSEPIIFTGSKDRTIRMWQYKSGQALCTISAHHSTIFKVSHHPSSKTFVSCDGDGVVCLWDYKTP